MAMSGVTLADNVVSALGDLRMKKSRYVVLAIGADGKQIAVEEVGERGATYADFAKKLAAREEPCYAGFDYEYKADGATKAKLLLIQWIPENAKPRSKMLYSSSREALTPSLEGFLAVQANDVSELEDAELVRKISSHRGA